MAAAQWRLAAAATAVSATFPARLTSSPNRSQSAAPRITPVIPPCLISLRLTPPIPAAASGADASSPPALSSAQMGTGDEVAKRAVATGG